jgi:membrane-bound serine protease (ClpP class)
VIRRYVVGDGPAGFATHGGAVWVIAHRDGALVRIDSSGLHRLGMHLAGPTAAPERLAWSDGSLWLTGRGLDLVRIDPQTGEELGTVEIGAAGIDLVALGVGLAVGLAVGWLGVQGLRRARLGTPGAYPLGTIGIAALAYGGAARLADVAGVVGVSPGSHIGQCPDCRVRPGLRTTRSLSAGQAVARKAADLASPTLGDFIVDLDGRTVDGHTLQTARVVQRGNQPRRAPSVDVSFAKLALLPRLLHTVASPSVAYLLLMAGMVLILFEFFTVGIGLAGGAGAGFIVLAAYGLAVLPTRPFALGLLILGMVGFGIDVQTGAPRVWTGVGAVSLVAGTWLLYDGVGLPLVTSVLTLLGVALFMLAAMPSVVRARFSTPTIGRESMVGERGEATAALHPEGMVRVREALWRARTNRATPIAQGDGVTVVGVEGLVLQVEPLDPDDTPDAGTGA